MPKPSHLVIRRPTVVEFLHRARLTSRTVVPASTGIVVVALVNTLVGLVSLLGGVILIPTLFEYGPGKLPGLWYICFGVFSLLFAFGLLKGRPWAAYAVYTNVAILILFMGLYLPYGNVVVPFYLTVILLEIMQLLYVMGGKLWDRYRLVFIWGLAIWCALFLFLNLVGFRR